MEWKDIIGYEGYYQVSNYGELRSVDREVRHSRSGGTYIKRGRSKASTFNRVTGYLGVGLYRDNKEKRYYTHRLVVEAFIGPIPKGLDVNHKDGDKTNNHVDNLEICTRQENIRHCIDVTKKFGPIGSRHWASKLSSLDIEEIKKLRSEGMKLRDIAEKFKVTSSHISNIARGLKRRNC